MGEEIPADWMLPHDFMRSFEGSAQAIAIDGDPCVAPPTLASMESL